MDDFQRVCDKIAESLRELNPSKGPTRVSARGASIEISTIDDHGDQ